MALKQPVMSFLRPLPLPRPATVSHFLRRLETTQARAAPREDPNLIASTHAPQTYPPRTLKSLPRPKESRASHRTSQPSKERNYPDRMDPKELHPTIEFLPESDSAPNLAYYVTRTPSNYLPIYEERKHGGNYMQTRVKKIDGSPEVLREALEKELDVPKKECEINKLTGHLLIKGLHKRRIDAFLKARRF